LVELGSESNNILLSRPRTIRTAERSFATTCRDMMKFDSDPDWGWFIAAAVLSIAACDHLRSGLDERVRIESATRHYASLLRGAPVDSVVAVYAEDGELIIPGVGTLHGRKAIHDFLAPLASSTAVSSATMEVDRVAIRDTLADAQGHYSEVAGPTGGATEEYRGTYVATWVHQADGQWRIARLQMQPTARAPQ